MSTPKKKRETKNKKTNVEVKSVPVSGKSHLIMADDRHYEVTKLEATMGGKKRTRFLASSAPPSKPFPPVKVHHTRPQVMRRFPRITPTLKRLI